MPDSGNKLKRSAKPVGPPQKGKSKGSGKRGNKSQLNDPNFVRHRDRRPDFVRKIRNAIKSQGLHAAERLFKKLADKEPKPGTGPLWAAKRLLDAARAEVRDAD